MRKYGKSGEILGNKIGWNGINNEWTRLNFTSNRFINTNIVHMRSWPSEKKNIERHVSSAELFSKMMIIYNGSDDRQKRFDATSKNQIVNKIGKSTYSFTFNANTYTHSFAHISKIPQVNADIQFQAHSWRVKAVNFKPLKCLMYCLLTEPQHIRIKFWFDAVFLPLHWLKMPSHFQRGKILSRFSIHMFCHMHTHTHTSTNPNVDK